jgi:hypothetical protein
MPYAGPCLIALAASMGMATGQDSVFWNSDPNKPNLISGGLPMDGKFRFEIGVFAGSFVPTTSNKDQWAANWRPAARTIYQTGTSRYASNLVVSSNASPFTAGKTSYVWGFRGGAADGEWILFRDPTWTWPNASGFEYLEWFAQSATPVIGQINSSGSPFLMKSAAVTSAAPPTTTWTQWKTENIPVGTSDGANDDPDLDGTPNLMEFVFGTDPVQSNKPTATPAALVSGHMEITIPRRVDHPATLVVEVSGDLVNWFSGAGHTQTVSDGVLSLVVRDLTAIDASNPRRFMRLRASIP